MNKAPFITPYVRFEMNNGILYVTYSPDAVITLNIAKEITKQRIEYTNAVPCPLLISYEGLKAFDKESRDYSAAAEGIKGVLAGALLTNSVYTEFFGNFFLRITKPEIPAKVFTDKAKALEWLEQFKPKS